MTSFQIFLYQKRIHAEAWQAARSEEYARLEALFLTMGATSFDQQKKFLFNPVRLEFSLPESLVLPPTQKKKSSPSLNRPSPQTTAKPPALKGKINLKPGATAKNNTKAPGTSGPKPPALKGKINLKPGASKVDPE